MTETAHEAESRQIDYVRLDALQDDPANPKAHDQALITESIGRFGYVEPVVIDARTGYLVSGHGRTASLRLAYVAGEEPPRGVSVDADGHWLIPAVTGWASKNDAEARAALIALNRTGERGGWDDGVLLSLLDELAETEEAFAGLGFDEADLAKLQRLADLEVQTGEGFDSEAAFADAGLDDLDNVDGKPFITVHVSIASQEDYDEFRRRLGFTYPRRTRTWFPEQLDLIESGQHLVAAPTAEEDVEL